MVLPVDLLLNSFASFTLCASPPDKVVADCPNVIYDNPTSSNVLIILEIWGWFSKIFSEFSTVEFNISAIVLPFQRIFKVSLLYLEPLQSSHIT